MFNYASEGGIKSSPLSPPPPSSSSSSNPYFSFSSSFLHAQEILLPTIQNSG